jgi:hypothetical protein
MQLSAVDFPHPDANRQRHLAERTEHVAAARGEPARHALEAKLVEVVFHCELTPIGATGRRPSR